MLNILNILIILLHFTTASDNDKIKEIPETVKAEVRAALEYYPQLKDVEIDFEFRKKIPHSTMQAQPKFKSILKSKSKRAYVVKIAEKIKIEDEIYYTKDLPADVMIGWIGHELGHIVDYQQRSNLGMVWFGIKYVLSDNYIVEAERAADTYAVRQGMAEYIIKTKRFILEHAKISEDYKLRIKKYYLSPEEILMLAEEENVDRIKESLKKEDDFSVSN